MLLLLILVLWIHAYSYSLVNNGSKLISIIAGQNATLSLSIYDNSSLNQRFPPKIGVSLYLNPNHGIIFGQTHEMPDLSGNIKFTFYVNKAGNYSLIYILDDNSYTDFCSLEVFASPVLSKIEVIKTDLSFIESTSLFTLNISLFDYYGNTFPYDCFITLSLLGSDATFSGLLSKKINGSGVFSGLNINKVGKYVIQASSATIYGQSDEIYIALGPVSRIVIDPIPSQIANAAFSVTFQMYDFNDNPYLDLTGTSISGNNLILLNSYQFAFTIYYSLVSTKQKVTIINGVSAISNIFEVKHSMANIEMPASLESHNFQYKIYALFPPYNDIQIKITANSSQFLVFPEEITFTSESYETKQIIRVSTVNKSLLSQWTKLIVHTSSDEAMKFSLTSFNSSSHTSRFLTLGTILLSTLPVAKEGSSTTYKISLSQSPSSVVQITISTNTPLISISPNVISFNGANYNVQQTITITSTASSQTNPGVNQYSLTHSVSTSDSNFISASTSPSLAYVYIIKSSQASVMISDAVVFQEGYGGSYCILLGYPPQDSVTISLSSTSSYISYSPSTLIFSKYNYNIPQWISLETTEGTTPRGLQYSASITHTVISGDPAYDGISPIPGSTIEISIINPCKGGMWAWPPGSGLCNVCPQGYSCTTLYADAIECDSNQYSPLGEWNCLPCPPGHSCNGSGMPQPCPFGSTAAWGSGICQTCTKMACDLHGQGKVIAPSGTYVKANGHSIYQCPPGYQCTGGTSSPSQCSTGQYSPPGSSKCTPCPAGYYCPDISIHIPLFCDPYSYSAGSEQYCHYCPIGYSCTTSSKIACTSGTIALEGWTDCVACDILCKGLGSNGCCAPGYYGTSGSCTICDDGYECDGKLKKPCPSGYYSTQGAIGCSRCNFGTYVNGYKQTSCSTPSNGYIANMPHFGFSPCYRGSMSNAGKYACLSCTPGNQCDNPLTPTACITGYFCFTVALYQSSAATQTACPGGYYNPSSGIASLSGCLACPAQYYCPEGSSTYISCPVGHYCPSYSFLPDMFPCPEGYYNPNTNQYDVSNCLSCNPGYFCPEGTNFQYPCPEGAFCPSQSPYVRYCPKGYTSLASSSSSGSCSICSPGTYCSPGAPALNCPMGTYNPNSAGSFYWDSCLACISGYACKQMGQSAYSTYSCEPGYYCPSGTEFARQYPCLPGTYSDNTNNPAASSCSSCTQGYFCVAGSTSAIMQQCPRGHFCSTSTVLSHTTPCPAGSYVWSLGTTSSSSCQQCPSSRYCIRGASWYSGYCQPGYYCPAGSTLPDQISNRCSSGTYQPFYNATDSTSCTACPSGSFCWDGMPNYILCPAGTYAATPGTSPSSCITCTQGNYCPIGTVTPIPCPAGYFSSTGASSCTICPIGYFCTGGTQASALGACPAGKLCPSGTKINPVSDSSFNCPAGYYCPTSTTRPIPCSAGTYTANTGETGQASCTNVNSGSYSLVGWTSITGICNMGYYCGSTSSGPYATPCPWGYYRNSPGGTQLSDCTACPAGYYCPIASINPIICPIGYYCNSGISNPKLCPKGTIGSSSGLSDITQCTDCPVGSYCSTPGLLVPDGFCKVGFLCAAKSYSSAQTTCTSGGYCSPGFSSKLSCPPGTYNPNSGGKDISWCKPCTQGYYCQGTESSITSNTCSPGYYCPSGSYWSKQKITPPGSYTTSGQYSVTLCSPASYNPIYAQSSCSTCPQGFYCDDIGMTSAVICPVGSYCTSGVSYYTQCPVGTFNPFIGLTSLAGCLWCTPGYYCPTSGLSSTPTTLQCNPGYYCSWGATTAKPSDYTDSNTGIYGLCPSGYYCLLGSPVAIPCPTGTFRVSELGQALTDCSSCTQGLYCTDTSLDSTQGQCDSGYYCFSGTRWPRPSIGIGASNYQYCTAGQYCPQGSYEPISCASGTYQDLDYQSTYKTCPQGFYCPLGTSNYENNVCPQGYYCPAGTQYSNQYPCPSGTYNPTTGLTDSSQCLQCTPGYYCQNLGQSAVSGTCSGGYFCKIGSKSSTPQVSYPGDSNGGKCIPGYYCPVGSAYALECDGGSYCATSALLAPTGLCSQGYYCIKGATSSSPTDGTTGNKCPSGHYCPTGSISPIACPKGTFLGSTGNYSPTQCVSCPPGEYCGNSALSHSSGLCASGYFCPGGNYEYMPLAGKCTPGNYCPSGSISKNACSPGYYQDQELQSSCKICPKGFYCPNSAMNSPTICDPGYYCPQGSINQLACPAGSYNPMSRRWLITHCLSCPPGKYCAGTANAVPDGDCQGGYYCTKGAVQQNPTNDAQGSICQKGYFCPVGSVAPTKCTPGRYCDTAGLSAVKGDCTAGYYCIEGSWLSTPRDQITGAVCPVGYYCPQWSAMPTPCSPGYYQSSQGKTQLSDCIVCPAGYYCENRASVSISGLCSAGYYCPQGQSTPTPIAYICQAGYYCPSGSGNQIVCQSGTYQDQIGQSKCKTCPSGFYCDTNEIAPHLCSAGYMCPSGTSSSTKISCGNGEYQPFQGQSHCLVCPMSYECGTGAILAPTICPIYSYCTSGTSVPAPYCPSGTYTDKTGLQSKDQCMKCPSGKWCTNGRVQGDCDPGFLCVSGSNTATPDSYTNTGSGAPCPEGYYCEAGTSLPTPCPSGKFRTATGGQSAADCSDCEAGYYCIMNDPVPKICPSGSYCPAGSSIPTKCPAGYYSLYQQASSISTCKICPAGYLCSYEGTSDYKNYPCTPGFYCTEGTLELTPSPAGKYSPSYDAAGDSNLLSCPSGYYCGVGSTGYNYCEEGTYCPSGSSEPLNCTAGNYCENVSSSPLKCPTGWYCPLYSSNSEENPPLLCPNRSVCASGVSEPVVCEAGYVATTATTISNPVTPICDGCPAGKYSNENTTVCLDCEAGYMCIGKTPTPIPVNLTTGYQCSRGNYCPVGALEEYSCPEGTYSNETALTSLSACLNCPVGQYNDFAAQTSCKVCGRYATSAEGSTFCTCKGKNRVYLQQTEKCICQASYESTNSNGDDLSNDDGDTDCLVKVYSRCSNGEIRDQMGNCRTLSDCSSECKGGDGTRSTSTGLCQCKVVDDVNQVCSQSCRESSEQLKINSNGNFEIYNPTSETTTIVKKSSLSGIKGSPSCYPNKSCKTLSVDMTSSGEIRGVFGVSSSFKGGSSRRLESSSKYIRNPVICLNIGESIAFSLISPDHYPVYMKHSLINSNSNFDYSEFENLKTSMKSGENATLFVYTFNQGGVYLFADASDDAQQMVIGVMTDSSQCPYTDSQIQPLTSASIHLIGTNMNTNIVQSIDWTVVVGLLAALASSLLIFTALFYYYTRFTWKLKPSSKVPYREINKKLEIQGDEAARSTMQMTIDGKIPDSSSSEAEDIREMIFEKIPDISGYDPMDKIDETNPIDSALVLAIKEKIRNNNLEVMKFLEDNAADTQTRLQKLSEETEELRNMLYELISPLDQFIIKPAKKTLNEIPNREESVAGSIPSAIIPDSEFQEALDEIADNKTLSEQNKNKLMNELSSELQKLEETVKADRSKQEEDLSRKLKLRAKRRKELENERFELERLEKLSVKSLENEIWEIKIKADEEEKQIQEDFNRGKEEIRKTIIGEEAEILQKKLNSDISSYPEKSQELIREYEHKIEILESNLTINQIREHQELVKSLEEKTHKKRADMKQKQVVLEEEIKASHESKCCEYDIKKSNLEIEEAVANALIIISAESHDNTLKELKWKQRDDLKRYEKELFTKENEAVTNLQKQASISINKLFQQKSNLERQKHKLHENMHFATDDEGKKKLSEIAKIESQVSEITENILQEQKKNLEDRLEIRRKTKDQKLKAFKKKQNDERIAIEFQAKTRLAELKSAQLEQAIKSQIGKLSAEKQNDAIMEFLEEKQELEREELQRKLRKKLRNCQKETIREVMRMKASDLEVLRNEFKDKIKIAGRDSIALEKLQKDEAEELSRIDYHYMKQLESAQEESWREQQKKNQQELIALIDQQLGETRTYVKGQNIEESEEKLMKEKQRVEEEGQKKLYELIRKKEQMEAMRIQKQKELEDLIRKEKQREEADNRRQLLIERKKALMEKQRKIREELQKRGQLTNEQMEKLISEHQRELSALENTIARERDRQMALMSQKLAEKRQKRNEYEESMQKLKEDQNKWQKEMEELPGITNKQATTMLLKWRKYPKRGLKDIEKAFQTIEPADRSLPLVAPIEEVSIPEPNDQKLNELVSRIDSVERIVKDVDINRFESAIIALDELENMMKSLIES